MTGFGVRVGGGVFEKKECSGGGWLREIAIVCGTNPFFANVTDWLSTDNVSEHGVWQVWPAAVLTAAPLGTDSIARFAATAASVALAQTGRTSAPSIP